MAQSFRIYGSKSTKLDLVNHFSQQGSVGGFEKRSKNISSFGEKLGNSGRVHISSGIILFIKIAIKNDRCKKNSILESNSSMNHENR